MTTNEVHSKNFDELLKDRGITRRSFVHFCSAIAATLCLSEVFVPKIAEALEESVIGKPSGALTPVVWLELASCTGCTESFVQVDRPDVATVILELLTLNYSEALSAGAGYSLEKAKNETIQAGDYILIIEGALMEGWGGNALRIADEKGTDIVLHAAKNAKIIICTGSCAVDGGWQAAYSNPCGAIGVQAFLEKRKTAGDINRIPPLINLPGCPVNPENLVALIINLKIFNRLPELNDNNYPLIMFKNTVHNNCSRRGHYENSEFVHAFGSEEEVKGYCLYHMGCKGIQTNANCPGVLWNRGMNWCIEAGAPCIGCAQADPYHTNHTWVDINMPVRNKVKRVFGSNFAIDSKIFAGAATGVVAAALIVSGFRMKIPGQIKKKKETEAQCASDAHDLADH